jgi:hypothetical protein
MIKMSPSRRVPSPNDCTGGKPLAIRKAQSVVSGAFDGEPTVESQPDDLGTGVGMPSGDGL